MDLQLEKVKEYASLMKESYDNTLENLPDGWEVLITSEELGFNQAGYYGMLCKNETTGELALIHRGTELDLTKSFFDNTDFKDLFSDLELGAYI